MKKSLSLLLAVVMIFSAFSSLAFAADQKTAAEIVAEAGIIKGAGDGNLREDEQWTRQDVAILLSRFYGEEEEAQNTPKNHTYADVKGDFYDGYLTWARDKGLMEGHSEVRFGFDEFINAQQFSTVLLRVLGIDFEWDDALEVAIENGLMPEDTDNAAPFTRGASFEAIVATLNTEVEEGVTLGAQLGLKGFVPEPGEVATDIASLKAVGAKKLEVVFNGEVDVDELELSVRRDGSAANISETKATSKTTVVIELTSNIVDAEYTVTAKLGENEVSRTISGEVEKVAKIELIGDVAGMTLDGDNKINGAKIGYTVFNQYGEDVTRNPVAAHIQWHASLSTKTEDDNKGVLTLEYPYLKDQVININAVVTESNYVQSFQVKIGDPAVVRTIEVKELWHPNDEELKTNSTFEDFYLLLEAKDQYGAVVNAATFNKEVIVSTVPSYVNVATDANDAPKAEDNVGPNGDMLGLPLAAPSTNTDYRFAGKSPITFIPKFGGTPVVYEINIVEAAKVDTITLSMPEGTVAQGDTGVEIPFRAVDQYGEEVTDFKTLNDQISLTNLRFEENYVDGSAKLLFDAPTERGLTFVLASVKQTGKSSQLTIDVKDARVADVIANTKDLKRGFVEGATASFNKDNVVIHDQYGKEFKLTSRYEIKVEVVDGNPNVVKPSGTEITTASGVTLEALAKGNERIRIKLFDNNENKDVLGSEYEFTLRVVNKDDVDEFVVDEIKPVYAADTHEVEVNVFGKLSDGTEVVVPHSIYSVTTTVYGLTYDEADKKLNSENVEYGGDEKDVTGRVIVHVDANGGIIVSEEVVATNKKPVIESVKFDGLTDGVLLVAADQLDADYIYSKIKSKDQYGVDISNGRGHLSFAKVTGSINATSGLYGDASVSATGAGSFNVTYITPNGLVTTVKVVVYVPSTP